MANIKILKSSVQDKSEKLGTFFDQFQGGNYVVYGELFLFEYDGNEKDFNLQTLKDIYFDLPDKKDLDLNHSSSRYKYIDGKINTATWNEAYNQINHNLRYAAASEGWQPAEDTMLDIVTNEEHEKRKQIFWKIIRENFDLPPDYIFFHEAHYLSYFSFYVMWGFCYIFLNDGKGLVIHAGAGD
ncbi:hypothetical protein K2W90_02920 [Candidatus Babeliales bacterium]|nr:hypothetical protein [Candidatus Babeliales bacterium]